MDDEDEEDQVDERDDQAGVPKKKTEAKTQDTSVASLDLEDDVRAVSDVYMVCGDVGALKQCLT